MHTLGKYINLLTDFGFKKLFGTKANKHLLIDFLNQLLPEYHQIQDLTYSKNEQLGKNINDRKAIYDIFCISKTGEHFIVELQRAKQTYFKGRSIYYSTFPIQEQAIKGEWDFNLQAVYTISILDFVLDNYIGKPKLVHHIQLKDEDGQLFYPKLNYIYIELPKFTKTLVELETRFEQWLFVFRWMSQLKNRPQELQDRIFEELFKSAEIANLSKMERLHYEQSLKQYRDKLNTLAYAKKEAKKEGKEEGKEEEKLEVIKIGLEAGFPLSQLSTLTRLSITRIKEIIAEQGWEIS